MGRLDLADKYRDEDGVHEDPPFFRVDATYFNQLRAEVEERKHNERQLVNQVALMTEENELLRTRIFELELELAKERQEA